MEQAVTYTVEIAESLCDEFVACETMQFETGKTYTTDAGRDYVWEFKILKRTAKFITILDFHGRYGETKRVRVSIYNGVEIAAPLGTYSMNPIISADREVA